MASLPKKCLKRANRWKWLLRDSRLSELRAITWRLYRSGFELVYLNLLPPPLDAFVRQIGRRVRSAFLRLAPR